MEIKGNFNDMTFMRNLVSSIDLKDSSNVTVVRASHESLIADARSAKRETKKASKRNLKPEAIELAKIREDLGMSQPDFAIALGESRDRIINIENGRVVRVPKNLLDKARVLYSKEKEERVSPLTFLESFTMEDLLNRWKNMVNEQDDKMFALILGTTLTTIDRWRKNMVRPKGNDLLRYELIAKKIQDKREEVTE